MPRIDIHAVLPDTPDVDICARWRVEAFASVIGGDLEAERASLQAFVADCRSQVALIARADGAPAGTCLLVPSEIAPKHAVSPWLAGLFVAPPFRRLGIGAALVGAIEAEARARGHASLYLYTDAAEPFYARLGWRAVDRVDWAGFDTVLMRRDLSEAAA